jgi:hypothetical protein
MPSISASRQWVDLPDLPDLLRQLARAAILLRTLPLQATSGFFFGLLGAELVIA